MAIGESHWAMDRYHFLGQRFFSASPLLSFEYPHWAMQDNRLLKPNKKQKKRSFAEYFSCKIVYLRINIKYIVDVS